MYSQGNLTSINIILGYLKFAISAAVIVIMLVHIFANLCTDFVIFKKLTSSFIVCITICAFSYISTS